MVEASLIIGIDTGGTYTDAVVIDALCHKILATAKAITTKGDLAIGVGEALGLAIAGIAAFQAGSVKMVAVSTTLATNAIVEGHGGAVALALLGFDAAMEERSGLRTAFGNMPIQRFDGGHDHAGREVVRLDEIALRQWASEKSNAVTAFAVAASFATRNADHELRAAQLIGEATGKPITLSHQLADALDAPRRAQTAVLNARLVSRVSDLIDAVHLSMSKLEITCPLMLVKGDGSLALAEAVLQRPIETVLSGPAASLVGAHWLSGLDDFIMADMGGTTTDVGLFIAGSPCVAEQGAEVGRWRTMVKAIDLKTIGLGGDSEVHIEPSKALRLGPQRVVPLSLLAARRPEVIELLQADLAETTGGTLLGKYLVLPFGSGISATVGLSAREAEVLAQVSDVPLPLRKVGHGSAALRTIVSLRNKGLVQVSAFSPSDAAHVLNLQHNWNKEAAVLAAKLAFKFSVMKMPDEAQLESFCRRVWDAAVQGTVRIILEAGFGSDIQGPLVDSVANGRPSVGQIKVSLRPSLPLVAVGGPVKVYYPEVGRRLGCEVVFSSHYEVANAVGAASALISCKVVVHIEGDGNGLFRVTGQGAPVAFTDAAAAIEEAEMRGQQAAVGKATAQGLRSPKLTLVWAKHYLPDASGDDGILTAELHVEAKGLPA